jgi:hypothetical protein
VAVRPHSPHHQINSLSDFLEASKERERVQRLERKRAYYRKHREVIIEPEAHVKVAFTEASSGPRYPLARWVMGLPRSKVEPEYDLFVGKAKSSTITPPDSSLKTRGGGFFLLKWVCAIISSADVYPVMRAVERSPRRFQSETLHSAENNSPLCRIDEILQRPQDRAREGILRLSESIPYKRVRSSGSHFRGEEISSQGSSFASYLESSVLLDSGDNQMLRLFVWLRPCDRF